MLDIAKEFLKILSQSGQCQVSVTFCSFVTESPGRLNVSEKAEVEARCIGPWKGLVGCFLLSL